MLARNNATPVPFWLSLPLMQLGRWTEENNQLEREAAKNRSVLRNAGKKGVKRQNG